MPEPRLRHDILNQPQSLRRVIEYQLGTGRTELADAAAAINRTRRVVLAGMGSSLFSCVPLQYLLVSHGVACEVIEAAELVHYLQGSAKGAAVVLVSRSGESVEIAKALDAVSDTADAVIGVTNEPQSRLAKETRPTIMVSSCADEMVAIQTYTGTMLALLMLGCMATEGPEREWRAQIEAAVDALAATITRFESDFECPLEFPRTGSSVYLLARGPSRGSALEGALLFNEVAKTSSTAMGAGDFRHGPVEVVNDEFRGILFAPNGVTGALNRALARDLRAFGGQVRVVGPANAEVDGFVWETADVPEALAPLVEIAPVQFAALRLAEERGITPGRFRYLRQVTVSESDFEQPVD